MKRRALDPAIAEISHLAGFNAAYQPLKQGKRVVGVRLAWGLKDRAALVEAQKELDRPRIGRTARRDGLVEAIAAERQRIAESLAAAPVDRLRPQDMGHAEHGGNPPRPEDQIG